VSERAKVLAPYAGCRGLLPEVRTMLDFAALAGEKLGAKQRRAMIDLRPGQRVCGMPYPRTLREALADKGLLVAGDQWEHTPAGVLVRQCLMHTRIEVER
jgi:hypothetical protein